MTAHQSAILKTRASIVVLVVLAVVAALGDMGCSNTGPKARSLTIVVEPAEDLWSGARPQYTPATTASTGGLLVFENNDDSDSAGGPDDTDGIVNGTADMRQMTTLIVRKLSSTPSSTDLLHVRKPGGMGNVNVFRKGTTPAASNRILKSTDMVTADSDATQLITDATNGDVSLLVEGVDPGDVDLCLDWSGTQACVKLMVRTGFMPRIFADTDRNTAVDPVADAAGKDTWALGRGAIVFVNNDRDCAAGRDDDKDPVAPSRIVCATDADDIAELQIPTAALSLAAGWNAVLRFPDAQKNDFRIFTGITTGSTQPTDTAQTVTAVSVREIDITALLAAGPTLRLGIEGREFAKPIHVDLCAMHGATRVDAACNRVALRTSELLLQANDETIGKAMVGVLSKPCATATAGCPVTNDRLRTAMAAVIPATELQTFATDDQWVQDEFELCGQAAPRGTSQVVLHLPRNTTPCSATEQTCEFASTTLPVPGSNHAYIDTQALPAVPPHPAITVTASQNFGGNLEVSRFNGTTPGKIILGANMDPALKALLGRVAPRQNAGVVELDVGWLSVGHVDEVMAVLPGTGGQRIVLADVNLGRGLLTGGAAVGMPTVDEHAALFWHCRDAARSRSPSCFGTGTVATATSGPTTFTSAAFSFAKPAGREWQFIRIYDGAGRGQIAQIGSVDAGNSKKVAILRVWRLDTPDWIRCAMTSSAGHCDLPAANTGRPAADALPAPVGATAPFWPFDKFVRDTWFTVPAAGDKFVVVEDSLDWDPRVFRTAGKGAAALAGTLVRATPALHTAGELRGPGNATFWTKQGEIAKKLDGPPASGMRGQLAGIPGAPVIVRLPMLYNVKDVGGTLAEGESLLPASVNLQVIRHSGGTLILVPKPYGPSTGGPDPYETKVSSLLAGLGATVRFVDDWEMYHILMGEIHCGTNQSKAAAKPWWTP